MININISINQKLFNNLNIPLLAEQVNNTSRHFLLEFQLDSKIKTSIDSSQDFLIVQVNNLKCFCPAYLSQQIFHLITNTHLENLWDENLLEEKLVSISNEKRLIFFNTLIHEIIKCQPGILITNEIINTLINQMPGIQQNQIAREKLLLLIQQLVSNFIPIRSIETLKELFENSKDEGIQIEEIFESIFDKWNNRFIELHIQEEYFKIITTASLQKDKIQSTIASKDEDLFMVLKDRLFYENGIIYPAIKIIFTDNIASDNFYITINNWKSIPFKGIAGDEMLVLKQPKNSGNCIYNIYNNTNYWLLNKSAFSDDDFSENIWPPFDYLVMMLSFPLRIKAKWFVDCSFTNTVFDKLEINYPQLIREVKNFNKLYIITQVLRQLVHEQISIRGMANILQQIINIDVIDADEMQDIIFDSRVCMPEALQASAYSNPGAINIYVRHHLKNFITAQCTHNTNNLSAILFEPALEKLLLSKPVTNLEKEKILISLRKEKLSPASAISLLTTSDVRPIVANLIEEEFPFISVVAYRELTEFTNITVISRINIE
ncbi:MAG: FHIPEP family type III secretion protein [Bacteroidetes bacterium]|nr:FHIPEP family type III secretion protein [Bacteroidota bacterium]